MKNNEWSEWFKLDEKTIDENVPSKSGTYKISCPESIDRFSGKDTEGVLVIGESGDIKKRIKDFFYSVTKKDENPNNMSSRTHSEGGTFAVLGLEEKYPIETLRFKFIITHDKDGAERLERLKIEEYENRFDEFPPLNHKPPKNWRRGLT